MKLSRMFVLGAVLATVCLATPQAQQSIINLTSNGWLVADGGATPLLLGSNGKGFIQVSSAGAVTFVNSATVALPSGATSTSAALTTPVIDGVTYSALNDRQVITEAFPVAGAALHAAVLTAVTFPANAVIVRAWLNITTVCTGACTIDVGYTATTATTSSDTLLDGIDGNAAVILVDSMDALLDLGANAHAQLAASAKWVTIDEKTGDSTGMVAVLYIQYVLV